MSVSRLRLLVLIVVGSSALMAAQHWPADAADGAIVGATQRAARPQASAAPQPTASASFASPASPAAASNTALTTLAAGVERAPHERSRSFDGARGDAFAVLHWLSPAPPAPPPAPRPAVIEAPPPAPAAPTAPPMPFVFVGMLEKGLARPQAFLAKGDTLLVVAAGDLLDNKTYRIDSLTPQEVVMTYLPLDTRQTLPVTGGTK